MRRLTELTVMVDALSFFSDPCRQHCQHSCPLRPTFGETLQELFRHMSTLLEALQEIPPDVPTAHSRHVNVRART